MNIRNNIIEIKVKVDNKTYRLSPDTYNRILDIKGHLTLKEYIKKHIEQFNNERIKTNNQA